MGSEATCIVSFGRRTSKGRALFETNELIFRGDFRLRIPFNDMKSVAAKKNKLLIVFSQGVVVFELGPAAEKWADKIRNPKSLIDKLGVKPDLKVSVLGINEETFLKQLRRRVGPFAQGRSKKNSDPIFLGAEKRRDLRKLEALQAFLSRGGVLWIVAPKGSQEIREADTLKAGRSAGLVDVKVASFSKTHTAHKCIIPVAKR
jgi:hypothetical protein